MTMQLTKATRQKTKIKLGLAGVSGSGKTYSALLLAKGIAGSWDKIAVIDTENGSADLYAHLGDYNTITLEAPYSPERYIEAIETCEKAGMEVIVIDSMTHEWAGTGGCLEIQEKLGGRYQDWAKVKPRHRKFLDKILSSNCHVITTVRSKQDYAMSVENGKSKVTKLGLKQVTEEGFEYELTISFDVSQNHLTTTSKDRTGVFVDKPEFVVTEATGKTIKKWTEKGIEPTAAPAKDVKEAAPQEGETKFIDTPEGKSLSKRYFATAKDAGVEAMKAKKAVKDQYKLDSYTEVTEQQLSSMLNAMEKRKAKMQPEEVQDLDLDDILGELDEEGKI